MAEFLDHVALITLPVELEAPLIADLTETVDGLDLGVEIPGVGTLDNLLSNPLLNTEVTTTGQSVAPCNCPEGATPTCSNATCSCDCPAGFFYNPVTQECLVAASGLARVKRSRPSVNIRQAKRSEIEARLRKH